MRSIDISKIKYDLKNHLKDFPKIFTELLIPSLAVKMKYWRRKLNVKLKTDTNPAKKATAEFVTLSTSGLSKVLTNQKIKLKTTVNDQTITEYAAVMIAIIKFKLLTKEKITEVTKIGTGADYALGRPSSSKYAEISGTNKDSELNNRFSLKKRQVQTGVTKNQAWVSVTSFEGFKSRIERIK